ncbi:MAG: hypothetical protein HYS27_05070 [Deltaproteobacteria bacterium]|nr:hypothetical protein [Deltaproteobacteria bacterium]
MSARHAIRAHGAVGVVLLLATQGGCPIGDDDLLPSMGAPCSTHEALCGMEHVCRPPGPPPDGVCAPVMSYGSCDDVDGKPSHPPGRLGDSKQADEVKIESAADLEQLREVRLLDGTLEVFEQGPGDADVGDLCPLRTLQLVTDGAAIGDSDLTDLDGLQSLTSVAGGLAVFNNRQLTSLSGLDNLVEVGPRTVESFAAFHVIIAGNPQLPESDITAFEQRLQGQNGNALRIVSCSNAANPCAGEEAELLAFLTANGVQR